MWLVLLASSLLRSHFYLLCAGITGRFLPTLHLRDAGGIRDLVLTLGKPVFYPLSIPTPQLQWGLGLADVGSMFQWRSSRADEAGRQWA